MIEAVNSLLANAPLIRSTVVQDKQAQNVAGVVEEVKKVPQAPYVSPYISYDVNLDVAVIQFRDSDTGDVVEQLPSKLSIESQRRNEATDDAVRIQTAKSNGLLQAQEVATSNSDVSSLSSFSVIYASSSDASANSPELVSLSSEIPNQKITVDV